MTVTIDDFTKVTDYWIALLVAYIQSHPGDAAIWLMCCFLVILVLAISKTNINLKFSAKGQGQKMDNPYDLTPEQKETKTRRLLREERKLWARKRFAQIVDTATAEEWGKVDPKTGWSLSLSELREFHRQVGRSTGCYDLMPRRLVLIPNPDALKKDILARVTMMKENRANKRPDLYDPVPLPDTTVRRTQKVIVASVRRARNKMEELLFSLAKAGK